MNARALLLAVLLTTFGGLAVAQSPTTEVYNVLATPLDDLSRDLLLETGYVIREDGKVWDKIADNAVRLDEMSYLLSRLAGARRLKALLELNLILNRSDGEKKLTEVEREQVRSLVRKNWAVFGVGTRKDFRSYFSVQELTEELDKIPPRFDRGSAMLMRDPDPRTASATVLAAAPMSVTAPPPAATYAPIPVPAPAPEPRPAANQPPRQFRPRSVLTPFLEPPSLRRPSPFAPRARTPEAEPVVAATPAPAPAPAPVPVEPTVAPAIAAVLGAMAPVDMPSPMFSGPPPAASAPSVPATPVAARPAVAPSYTQPAPPPLTPQVNPVTSGPVEIAAVPTPVPAPTAVVSQNLPGMVFARPGPATAVPSAPIPSSPAPVPVKPASAVPPNTALFGSTPPPQPETPEGLGQLKPWTPPGTAAPVVPVAPASVVAPAAAPAPQVAAPANASQAEYDAFIARGPYSREGQALLKMLSEKAPEFCRAILRRTVVRGAPLIVFDGARAGADRRAGFAPSEPSHPGATIALSPGPVLVERKKGFFGKTMVALPEDPRAWAELGLPVPPIDALRKNAVSTGQEKGTWGLLRTYGDHSRRGIYTPQEQAGELLERLLLLGLEREGFAASTYAARAWARAARLLFSARVAEEYGNDAFLDPDRRYELRDWIERGDESDDLLVASWSSSRGNVLDPRRGGPDSQARYERAARQSCTRSLLSDHLAEAARNLAARARTVEALLDAGLISEDAAKVSAQKAADAEAATRAALLAAPPVCDGRFGADEAGLRRSTALLAEVSRAERAFREHKTRGTNND